MDTLILPKSLLQPLMKLSSFIEAEGHFFLSSYFYIEYLAARTIASENSMCAWMSWYEPIPMPTAEGMSMILSGNPRGA